MAGGAGDSEEPGFQIAPMIDLILVLMVFFMCTVAVKQVENELGISLPGTKGPQDSVANVTVDTNINIDPNGSVSIGNEEVGAPGDKDLPGLRARLKELVEHFSEKAPVVINPQQDVPHSRVVDVLNACAALKLKNISFGG